LKAESRKKKKDKKMKDKKGNKAKTNDQETEPKLKEVEKDLVKTKKRDRDDDDDEKDGKKNSSTHRKEWQTFGRWVKNKKRCPAKIAAACKDQDCLDHSYSLVIKTFWV
jgi:hypothetical protein